MVRCRDLEHLNIINYELLLLSGCMSGGIWWALRLVGLLDERNVVEWSVVRCSGCRVLMCGRFVLLMVCRLSSRVPCGKSGFSPCYVLCATHCCPPIYITFTHNGNVKPWDFLSTFIPKYFHLLVSGIFGTPPPQSNLDELSPYPSWSFQLSFHLDFVSPHSISPTAPSLSVTFLCPCHSWLSHI